MGRWPLSEAGSERAATGPSGLHNQGRSPAPITPPVTTLLCWPHPHLHPHSLPGASRARRAQRQSYLKEYEKGRALRAAAGGEKRCSVRRGAWSCPGPSARAPEEHRDPSDHAAGGGHVPPLQPLPHPPGCGHIRGTLASDYATDWREGAQRNKQSEGVRCSSAPGVRASPRTPSACTPAGPGRPLHRDRACDTPRAENFMLWLHHHR